MPKKLTQGKVLTALHKGAVIRVVHINEPPSGSHTTYRLSSNGYSVPAELVERMLADELIRPHDGGLPGFGSPQSYTVVRSGDSK